MSLTNKFCTTVIYRERMNGMPMDKGREQSEFFAV